MLRAENMTFRYGRRSPAALDGVSLTLEKGKIGVVLGKNGSGKTTLFRALLGINRPDSGSAEFDGKDLLKMSHRERAGIIAYVPQDIRFGALSVFDSVLMGRVARFGLNAGKEDYDAAERILRDMGLDALASRNADELSGGERQKLAIARAVAQEPQMLICDEPTGNLDPANEQLIMRETARLSREKGLTVLCSLHDLNAALCLGDSFFFMKEGKVKYSGGKEIFTADNLADIFGVKVKLAEIENRTVILGENFYEDK